MKINKARESERFSVSFQLCFDEMLNVKLYREMELVDSKQRMKTK